MTEDPKLFVVGYHRTGVRMVAQSIFFAFFMSVVAIVLGLNVTARPVLALLLLASGSLLAVACPVLAIQIARRKGPALMIGEAGLAIGFISAKPVLLDWSDVANVIRYEKTVNGRTFAYLAVKLHDEKAFFNGRGPLAKINAHLCEMTGHEKISLGLTLLDRPWEEIEEAVYEARPRPPVWAASESSAPKDI